MTGDHRYHLVTFRDSPGGFTEFSAEDDDAAIAHAERHTHGARVLELWEVQATRFVRRVLPCPATALRGASAPRPHTSGA